MTLRRKSATGKAAIAYTSAGGERVRPRGGAASVNESRAYIERIRRVSRGQQRLELAVEPSLAAILPGQALLVRRIEKDYDEACWHPYLRELWHPVESRAGKILSVERDARASYAPGQLLSVLGPVGQPFRFHPKLRNMLLIAHDAAPAPLLLMLPALLARGVSVTLVLMASARAYDASHLPEELEIVLAEDDLSWQDMVMTWGWADQAFVLTRQAGADEALSQIMSLARERLHEIPANFLFAVAQRPMPCGVGACHVCMLQLRGAQKLQCLDGPAFDMTAMRLP